jgi:hypothetical protein
MDIEQIISQAVIDSGIPVNLTPFLIAQSKHETANYTSNVFKSNKNLFGYKYYGGSSWQIGKNIISPEGNQYANYDTYYNSARELTSWIKRRIDDFKNVKTIEEYVNALHKNSFFTDNVSTYLNGMKHFYETVLNTVAKHKNYILPLLIAGAVGFIIYRSS